MTEPIDPFASAGPNADGYDPDKFYLDAQHNILRYANGSWRGKPYLPHPETGKLTAWGRPSSLGKPLDDATSLGNWRLVKTAEGMTARKDLQYRMAGLDQRDGADFTAKLDIANEAIDAAGGADGRTRGTAMHSITERLDRGERVDLSKLPEDLGPMAAAYVELIEQYGLTFTAPGDEWAQADPDNFMRERFVINTETMTAGTFDHIGWRDAWGLPRILDAKCSKDPEKYGHGFAIQMADYAYAGWMLPKSWDFRTSTVVDLLLMPEVDKRWGAIIWMRDGRAELKDVRLDAGWHAVTTILPPIKGWRARKDLVMPHDPARDRQPAPAEALFTSDVLTPATTPIERPAMCKCAVLPVMSIAIDGYDAVNNEQAEALNAETLSAPDPLAPVETAETATRPPMKMRVMPRSGRRGPIPVDPSKHQGPEIPVNPEAHGVYPEMIYNTLTPPVIPSQRAADRTERLIDTPPIISIDDPITDPEQVVSVARVDPGRAPVLAERASVTERETKRRAIAAEIRAAKSRAELAGIFNQHAAEWWDGATELGNRLFPPTSV